jgi:predicted ATPase
LGRTLDFEVLRAMSELPEEALVRALEEAERGQVVVSDDRGRLTFVHELTRQTLLSGVTALRRQRLHLRAAEAIERMHRGATDVHLAELAGHYRAAGGAADPAKVVEYSTRAGDRALDIGAYAESIRYFGDAIAALDEPRRQSANDGALADLHRKTGTAYKNLAKWPEARRHFAAALDLDSQGYAGACGAADRSGCRVPVGW